MKKIIFDKKFDRRHCPLESGGLEKYPVVRRDFFTDGRFTIIFFIRLVHSQSTQINSPADEVVKPGRNLTIIVSSTKTRNRMNRYFGSVFVERFNDKQFTI